LTETRKLSASRLRSWQRSLEVGRPLVSVISETRRSELTKKVQDHNHFTQNFILPFKMPFSIVDKEHHDVYPSIDPKGKLSGAAAGKVVVLTGAGKGIGEVRHEVDVTEIRRLLMLSQPPEQKAL